MQKTEIRYYYDYNTINKYKYNLSIDNYDYWIDDNIKNLKFKRLIGLSSFFNMMSQTIDSKANSLYSFGALESIGFSNIPKEGILFNRDGLLYLISRKLQIDSLGCNKITKKNLFYFKSLLLSNSVMCKDDLYKDVFIRDYPYPNNPDIVEYIYHNRVVRYEYIFNVLLKNEKYFLLERALKLFLKEYDIDIVGYFKNIKTVIFWFLTIPLQRKNNSKLEDFGFNEKDINSFYINKKNFKEDLNFIKFFKKIALNKTKFLKEISENRLDKINGFYKNIQIFFDYPVFEINKDSFCIMDLRFLMDGLCSGFLWRINKIYKGDVPDLKAEYGKLLEKYFCFLLNKIFKDITLTNNIEGEPDAILENKDYILIMEFTTEYYKISSLYNKKTKYLKKDLYKILFNKKEDYPKTKKKDRGKFLKLEKYIEKYKNKNKKIIPILITENTLGDPELLNHFDEFIDKNINSLKEIKNNIPTIINLDDLENFWQFSSNRDTSKEEFINFILKWREEKNKVSFHYNFTYFISNILEKSDKKIFKNKDFSSFFK